VFYCKRKCISFFFPPFSLSSGRESADFFFFPSALQNNDGIWNVLGFFFSFFRGERWRSQECKPENFFPLFLVSLPKWSSNSSFFFLPPFSLNRQRKTADLIRFFRRRGICEGLASIFSLLLRGGGGAMFFFSPLSSLQWRNRENKRVLRFPSPLTISRKKFEPLSGSWGDFFSPAHV